MTGTCSKEQGFFNGGSAVFAIVSSGPGGSLVDTKAVGVVREDVATVVVRSSSEEKTVQPTQEGGFTLDISGLKKGAEELNLQTLDSDGTLLHSYALPRT